MKEARIDGAVSRVGRYQLAYELASGGMATVYLARADGAEGFDKVVALKRIHPHLAKERDFIEMFLDEARIASRISHPNVCSVFDFGKAEGSYYIAMEFVMGETLGRLVRRLRQDPATYKDPRLPGFAARMIAGACDGLHAAHELTDDEGVSLNVVHRDVSPQNLFVGYDGTVRVVDFGIARAAGRLHETRTGTVKGKLAYMPPEQARKQPVDRRADVWALGVVLWELLCAKRLFKRENDVETILAVVNDDIPAPSKVRATVPEALDAIVMKALSREPEGRYETARQMSRDLHRFLATIEEPVTNADVGDWMSGLFVEERARRQALVKGARTVSAGELPVVAEGLEEEPSESEVRPLISDTDATDGAQALDIALDLDAETKPIGVPAPVVSPTFDVNEEDFDATRSRPRFRADHIVYGVGGVLVLGAILGVLMLGSGGDETPVAQNEVGSAPVVGDVAAGEDEPVVEDVAAGEDEPIAEDEPVVDDEPVVEDGPPSATMRRPPGMRGGMAEPSAMTSAAPGHVNIATPGGWADVFLDGRRIGRAPGRVDVPAGRQTLELRPFGGDERRRIPVRVSPGETARIVVQIQR